MNILNFFIRKIFLKRWLIILVTMLLLFLANYLIFNTARSIISTYQGYQEIEALNKEGAFIANLDPNSESNFDKIEIEDTRKLYKYLANNYKYAFQIGGFMSSLPNKDDMEVTFNYINEEYYKIEEIKLSKGNELEFTNKFNNEEIPVLVGVGLAKTYPLGSNIKVEDPVTNKLVNLKVQGVLEKNTYRSNFYAPNSKNYFNFAIFVPINEIFIQQAGLDLHVNGLMDMILLDVSRDEIVNFKHYINKTIGLDFNFFSQKENFAIFEEYYVESLKIVSIITLIILLVIVCLVIWSIILSIRIMIKDFTINLLIGLSYKKMKFIFYSYIGILLSVNLMVLCIIIAFNRYGFWISKDSMFATYGIFGLINIDWMSLLIVIFINFVIGFVTVEITIMRVKKIPISIGVLK